MIQTNVCTNEKLKEEDGQIVLFRIKERLPKDITLASEDALAKDWLSAEEDLAWADL